MLIKYQNWIYKLTYIYLLEKSCLCTIRSQIILQKLVENLSSRHIISDS